MALTNTLIFISFTFLILAFLLYTPLPEDVEEPWTYRMHGVMSDAIGITSYIVSKITGWQPAYLSRKALSIFFPKVHHHYPELEVKDLRFEGVLVRVYKPKSLLSPAPCVIYLHGGGWVIYDIDTHDSVATYLALRTNMIVVTIDYRLAPENPYPAPLDDCLKATKYVLQNGQQHGIDVHRVAISGDSAGGNMATVVSLRMSEEDPNSVPPLKLQVLIYPVTQVLNMRTSSYRLYKNYPVLSRRLMSIFIASYFGLEMDKKVFTALETNHHITSFVRRPIHSNYFKEEFIPDYVRQNPEKDIVDPFDDDVDEEVAQKMDSHAVDPYVSPLMAEDSSLSKLPPAYVYVSEFDVLRDDGLLYTDRLRKAGVKVELSYGKGQPHSFMAPFPTIFAFKGATREWDKIYAYLKENL